MTEHSRVLYVIACATPAARDIGKLIGLAQEQGWTVCAIATPSALKFLDVPALEQQTGFPVRSEYKQPGTPDVLPPADAMIVGGASFNTINKWAHGHADNLALGLLTEAVGLKLPLAALPFLNTAQAAHPAFYRSVKELREIGVKVLVDDDGYYPAYAAPGRQELAELSLGVGVGGGNARRKPGVNQSLFRRGLPLLPSQDARPRIGLRPRADTRQLGRRRVCRR